MTSNTSPQLEPDPTLPPEPSISISITLTPCTYSYSTPEVPTLSVHMTSHAPRPITVFTWNTVLHPYSGLKRQCFTITDTSSGEKIPQNKVSLNRTRFRRQIGSSDEQLFSTLYPDQPVTVKAAFGPWPGEAKPIGHPERFPRRLGWGVDGLEVGHGYEVKVSSGQMVIWWKWGTKEEVLAPPGESEDSYMGESEWPPIEIEVEETPAVEFAIEA